MAPFYRSWKLNSNLQPLFMKYFCWLICVCAAISCNTNHYEYPHVMIETRLGDIEIELYPKKAPETVKAFLSYIETGLYTNSSFYRVLKAEEMPTDFNTGVIQGGIYQSKSDKIGKIKPIPHESTKQTGLSHTDGTISFANAGAGTATTEFFICIGDQLTLDAGASGTADRQGYAAFGKVFKGMKVVRKIQNQNSHGDRFDENIDILRIRKL